MKWIKVEDRLPKTGSSVLTYPHFRVLPFGDDDISGFWEFSSYHDKVIEVNDVTHWQPLPKPPEFDIDPNENGI